jgi:uncharacterized membrane protein
MNDMCHNGEIWYMKMGSLICHRKPERTFKINNWYFPVCSRCTGIYIGAFSYFLIVYWVYFEYNWVNILLTVLLVVPTFMDGFTQLLLSRESTNTLRVSTGILAGIGLGVLVKAFKYMVIS